MVDSGTPLEPLRVPLQQHAARRRADGAHTDDGAAGRRHALELSRGGAGGLRGIRARPAPSRHLPHQPHPVVRRHPRQDAHAVQDAVAHRADRAERRGAAQFQPDPEPERAERARRRLVGRARQVRRHLVGDAHQQGHVGVRPETRRHDGRDEALHRLRRGQRVRGRAGRGLERRLGRRLVLQRQAVQLHAVVPGLRPEGRHRLRAQQGRAPRRPSRDLGATWAITSRRCADGVRAVRIGGRATGQDRLRGGRGRHPAPRRARRRAARMARRPVPGRSSPARAARSGEAQDQHQRARAGERHGPASHLPELDLARGRTRPGIQRAGATR